MAGSPEFLNFLFARKYNIEPKNEPIIHNYILAFGLNPSLVELENNLDANIVKTRLLNIQNMIGTEDDKTKDLISCMLYTSEFFVKLSKTKCDDLQDLIDFYRLQMQNNKKYFVEFNKEVKNKPKNEPTGIVCTRFPPEPSGYLHIGHAKAALLNQQVAKDGILIVRMDDTNPEKESKVFEAAILEDLKMLKITNYKLTHSSDYFDLLFDYAKQLIKEGKAYVDNTDRDTMQKQRTEGIPSVCRNVEPETSLKIFEEMAKGRSTEYCLRAKISIDDPNKAMRDPVIYRISNKPHHATGDKYKIYPTYDFTVPIIDSIEGVTHTLRTSEFRDRNPLYLWFIDSLGLKNKPKLKDFSRLCFDNTVVSKRKMKYYVENGFVDGWDDPRLCTLRGLRRSGMHPDALIDYITLQGGSQKTAINSWDKIWAMNKQKIDPISPRYSAILSENHVKCQISNLCSEDLRAVQLHKKNPELGTKQVLYSSEILISQEDAAVLEHGEEFTLINWGNAIVENKEMNEGLVIKIELKLHLKGDYKLTKNKINWVTYKGAMYAKFNEYGNLQNNSDSDDLAEKFNKESKKSSWWLVESAVQHGVIGGFVQFERIGFFYYDKYLEFNLVPYTKQKRNK